MHVIGLRVDDGVRAMAPIIDVDISYCTYCYPASSTECCGCPFAYADVIQFYLLLLSNLNIYIIIILHNVHIVLIDDV
jgi:hypothetical protein